MGFASIGHFAFFHSRFQDSLWPIALRWLRDGELDDSLAAYLVQPARRHPTPA